VNMLKRSVAALICLWMLLSQTESFAATEPAPAEADQGAKSILEKSLSIVEIDKEIARIDESRQATAAKITESERLIGEQETLIEGKREQAGAILRAYYTGERQSLWLSLLSLDKFSDLFAVFDYFNVIFENDGHTLDRYTTAYREIKSLNAEYKKTETELNELKSRLVAQRNRVAALQSEVQSELDQSGNREQLQSMIQDLIAHWQSSGIEAVQTYFRALAAAMKDFPELLDNHRENIVIDGFNYTVQIKETDLNAFLRQKNPLFKQMEFKFEPGLVKASGKQDNMEVSIYGNYTLEEEPENAIRFHVDRLTFNGIDLPDTTCRDLEKQFDLSFYPQKVIALFKATDIKIEQGKLIVDLTIAL